MKTIATDTAPAAIGAYSQAIVANGLVFVSGQLPLSPENGVMVTSGIKAETEQAIKNISAILSAAGSDLTKVVRATCYLTNIKSFNDFNEVFARYFTGKPARVCVEVAALPRGASVEIEAIATE